MAEINGWIVSFFVLVSVLVIFSIIIFKKTVSKRKKHAIKARDIIREIRDSLSKVKENYDSRVQWTFQKEGDYEAVSALYNYLSNLLNKGNWKLGGLFLNNYADVQRIRGVASSWSNKKPDYFNREKVIREVKNIFDTINGWK